MKNKTKPKIRTFTSDCVAPDLLEHNESDSFLLDWHVKSLKYYKILSIEYIKSKIFGINVKFVLEKLQNRKSYTDK